MLENATMSTPVREQRIIKHNAVVKNHASVGIVRERNESWTSRSPYPKAATPFQVFLTLTDHVGIQKRKREEILMLSSVKEP
jgi:hypothetical protein